MIDTRSQNPNVCTEKIISSGSKIRFLDASVFIESIILAPVYQYVIQMLFEDNNWQNIYISKLYHDKLKFSIILATAITKFNESKLNKYLINEATRRYGPPFDWYDKNRETLIDAKESLAKIKQLKRNLN